MSPQNFQRVAIDNDNVKTETLERIATAIGESVSYFYNEVPILSLDDYARIHSLETENKYLRALLEEKERTIQVLLSSKQ